jgi:uncharacterized damage-inducible protein DinB
MGVSIFISLFKYKAWANEELFAELKKLDAVVHQADLHSAIRILNHVYVVDRIFAAHLSGIPHTYIATNAAETPALEALRCAVSELDRWYVEYVASISLERLSESLAFTFIDGSNGCMSREEILAHITTHGMYHCGALGRIMSQLSLVPPESFAGYLHKAEPMRRERT